MSPIKTLLAALLLLVGLGPAQAEKAFPPGLFGGPFSLMDQTGKTVSDTDFRGRFMLIYFGYTFCPDICPGDLSRLATALDNLPPAIADRVQPIFITVDPERDTPAIAGPFAAAFHPKLLGLSGNVDAVKQAVTAYRVHRAKVFPEGVSKDDYLVSHSPNAYLMGPDGGFLTLFPHDSDPQAIAAAIMAYAQDPKLES
jgi:protein SCO1/2